MPIVIKDFKWNQTENTITIQVPIKGVLKSKADVFVAAKYLKISYEKYFFEVLLYDVTDPDETKCTFTSNEVFLELSKCEPKEWETLEDTTIQKSEKQDLKTKLIAEEHARLQAKTEEKQKTLSELKRVAVREQIRLDTNIRERIETIIKTEEQTALGDLNKWKAQIENPKTLKKLTKKPASKIPKLRQTKSLQVIFTPREFPTPIRESKLDEENTWLKQQAKARRTAGFSSEDIRAEERNPQFLLFKGDEFMKNSNYLGAISAYSYGIKLSDQFVDLYVARSAAHLAIGNYNRAATDCSRALELMRPAVPANLNERAICIGRRGIALDKLGLTKQGIGELEASLKLVENPEFDAILSELKNSQD